ncbi:ExeA family protein [Marinobacter sp. 1Y8]
MYYEFFGFREPPFSIAPDPRYLYLSERHKEALAHLMYGVQGQGGFIVITGEVGTGKTTVCRCFIENVPDNVDIALVLNPRLSARELLSSICDELGIAHPSGSSIKKLIDLINHHLLESHAAGRHKVLIIDEAQNLSADVLEQLRLLTNLETAEKKLLQIVLLGQPELQDILDTQELRQLSQRITARYHLDAISRDELSAYLRYRLSVAGQKSEFFTSKALSQLYRVSRGIPRVINLVCDRALLGAYAEGSHEVGKTHIVGAAREVLGKRRLSLRSAPPSQNLRRASAAAAVAAAVVMIWVAVDQFRGEGADTAPVAQAEAQKAPPSDKQTEKQTRESTDAPASEVAEAVVPVEVESEVTTKPTADQSATTLFTLEPTFEQTSQELGQRLSGQGKMQTEAYRQLFERWSFDYVSTEWPYACEFAETVGLRCLHRQGNWRSLRQINRPAILSLYDQSGNPRFATLIGLEGNTATLVLEGEQLDFPVDVIDQFWLGDYSLVWRVPPYESGLVPANEAVSEGAWLSAKMMQLISTHEASVSEQDKLIAAPLKEQVRWYQSTMGLIPDGIAGAKTLIQMNSDLYPSIPTLSPVQRQTAGVR